MQQWEYKQIHISPREFEYELSILNEAGLEGWEVVDGGDDMGNGPVYLMKRPLVIPSHILLFGQGTPLCETPNWTGWVTGIPDGSRLCPDCRKVERERG